MEDLWIWKSNICRYEGINLTVIDEFLDISGKEVGLSFSVECSSLRMNLTVTLRLFILRRSSHKASHHDSLSSHKASHHDSLSSQVQI
jgi:hypothetical protein